MKLSVDMTSCRNPPSKMDTRGGAEFMWHKHWNIPLPVSPERSGYPKSGLNGSESAKERGDGRGHRRAGLLRVNEHDALSLTDCGVLFSQFSTLCWFCSVGLGVSGCPW